MIPQASCGFDSFPRLRALLLEGVFLLFFQKNRKIFVFSLDF